MDGAQCPAHNSKKENLMSECKTGTSCETENSCAPQYAPQEQCTLAEDLVCLAKEAKHALLMEKMKKIIDAKMGPKLDKIAALGVEAMMTCWQQKMAQKEACNQYKDNLMAALKG
jgi:hypothetical protein